MLVLREKILILFATAPDDFAATRKELRLKFRVGSTAVANATRRLLDREILLQSNLGKLTAGKVLREELGLDE